MVLFVFIVFFCFETLYQKPLFISSGQFLSSIQIDQLFLEVRLAMRLCLSLSCMPQS